ncbi:MAG: Eco47II family restriction endonuclease [Candidatus Woesearchaeota archaeon]
MPNKYVDFVSDEEFLECVKWVCDAYPKNISEIDMKKLHKNTIDPIKQIFDMVTGELSYEDWLKKENFRQVDKTVNNRIGEFHQMLLGKIDGWSDLGVGDLTKVDLKKNDNGIFIELKNKENTVNADSKNKLREKIEAVLETYPDSIVYWAYILSSNGDSGEDMWKLKGFEDNVKVRKIWGKQVYQLITGDSDGLEKVWKALPIVISDIIKKKVNLPEQDLKILQDFFESAFH